MQPVTQSIEPHKPELSVFLPGSNLPGPFGWGILLPAWLLPERETNHADVAEVEILAKRVHDCVLLSSDMSGKAIPKPRQAVSWKKKASFPGLAPQLVIE